RAGGAGDPDADRSSRTSIASTAVYVGAMSWSRLVVHPLLGCVFLAALFVAPAVAIDLAIDFPRRARSVIAARRWRQIAYAITAVLLAGCTISPETAASDY